MIKLNLEDQLSFNSYVVKTMDYLFNIWDLRPNIHDFNIQKF